MLLQKPASFKAVEYMLTEHPVCISCLPGAAGDGKVPTWRDQTLASRVGQGLRRELPDLYFLWNSLPDHVDEIRETHGSPSD